MREAETRTAAPSAKGSGGKIEPIGKGYRAETYRPIVPAAIPSPEDPSRLARVVSHAGRLYAVAPFRELRS